MRKKTAKEIIGNGIELFPVYFDLESAGAGVSLMMGKISLGAELGLISQEEMDIYIDELFEKFDEVKCKK